MGYVSYCVQNRLRETSGHGKRLIDEIDRVIPAQTGVTYYRCALSGLDERYPKYPRLPVLTCPGHTECGIAPAQTRPTPS